MKRALLLSLALLVAGAAIVPQSSRALSRDSIASLVLSSIGPAAFGLFKFVKWIKEADKTKTQKIALKSGGALSAAIAAPLLAYAGCKANSAEIGGAILWPLALLSGFGSCLLAESAIEEYKK